MAVSEAPPKGNTLGQYRFFKETELPLLMRLEDPGERRAALHDIAKEHNLGLKNLQSALTAAEKQAQEAAEARTAAEEHEGEDARDEALVPSPAPSAARGPCASSNAPISSRRLPRPCSASGTSESPTTSGSAS